MLFDPYPLNHMPSTPMTQEEMELQCKYVSGILSEEEIEKIWGSKPSPTKGE